MTQPRTLPLFPALSSRTALLSLTLIGAVACDVDPDQGPYELDPSGVLQAETEDDAAEDIFAQAASVQSEAIDTSGPGSLHLPTTASTASQGIHATANALGMDVLDLLEFELTQAEHGIDKAALYVVLRAGLRTETLILDLDGTCTTDDAACINGAPALLRLQHKREPDGKSGTVKQWQRDFQSGAWTTQETVAQKVEADGGNINYSAGWSLDGDPELLLELGAQASTIRAATPADDLMGSSPFVSAPDGSGPLLFEPYQNQTAVGSLFGSSTWVEPPLPDYGSPASICSDAVYEDIMREVARIDQLSRGLDGASVVEWFDPAGVSGPLGAIIDVGSFMQTKMLEDSRARLDQMYAWYRDCLERAGPIVGDLPPDAPNPGDWDVTDFSTCRICTELLTTGTLTTRIPTDLDDGSSIVAVEEDAIYIGEATCLQWQYSFGLDVNSDGYCD